MNGDPTNPIMNVGDLAKPADTLIKKVSDAIGGYFAPYQIKRIAKAEAEANLIKAQTHIEITEMHRRAMHRFIEEEARKQENIEDITVQAIPHLSENADAGKIDNDWITNFFDKSRIVSDKEMQGLWARVLAGEVNSPGAFSRRTVNFLGDLDKGDAELFTKLCGYVWNFGGLVPLIFDTNDKIYTDQGINFEALNHLESIGLMQFNYLGEYARIHLPKRFLILYYGQPIIIEMEKDSDNQITVGHAMLTKTGQELAKICGSKPVDGFLEYVKEKWKQYLPKPATEQTDEASGTTSVNPTT